MGEEEECYDGGPSLSSDSRDLQKNMSSDVLLSPLLGSNRISPFH